MIRSPTTRVTSNSGIEGFFHLHLYVTKTTSDLIWDHLHRFLTVQDAVKQNPFFHWCEEINLYFNSKHVNDLSSDLVCSKAELFCFYANLDCQYVLPQSKISTILPLMLTLTWHFRYQRTSMEMQKKKHNLMCHVMCPSWGPGGTAGMVKKFDAS